MTRRKNAARLARHRDAATVVGLAIAAVMAGGCVGSIGDGKEDPSSPGWLSGGTRGPGAGAGGEGANGEGALPLAVGGYHLMRLTRAEYDNTVRDLLGDASSFAKGFAPDEKVGPFDANVLAPPSEGMLDDYMSAAEALASNAVQDLAKLTGCSETEIGTDACAESFIERFGTRGYRRPLKADEAARLSTVFAAGKELGGFSEGIELVVRAVLQSPNFLYRVEQGEPVDEAPEVSKLTGYEMASRLSYFLWDSMPDDDLLEAAAAGDLGSTEGLEAEARRLLASPKAEAMVASFHVQWMSLGVTLQKDPTVFPEFTDALPDSMRNEVGLFATDVILRGDGKLATLFTAPYTFADAALASIYEVERNSEDPAEFVRVSLDPEQRSGLLTLTGPLAATSSVAKTSPVVRGRFIRAYLLCQPPPPPPPDVNTMPEVDPNRSQREQLEAHRKDPACASCHDLMDPLGYGLDSFDAIGRYRTTVGDFPVDASGNITLTDDIDGEFEGAVELSQRLASSKQVAECVARQWFRFAIGRPENTELDAASLEALDEAFTEGDVRDLLVAIATTDAFRYRPTESEITDEGAGQ